MKPIAASLAGFAVAVSAAASPADAQTLGQFRWQLQPYCNVVTVTVTQMGAVYTLDGFDDQCGAGQRAPLVGLATPNPDGTIGLGLQIVTVPGGHGVNVDARITLAGLGGPWSDSAGNSGTFVFNGQAAGSPRPAVTGVVLPPNIVNSTTIVDGSIGAADIDPAQVQLRLTAPCARGTYMIGAAADGQATCSAGTTGGNVALGASTMPGTFAPNNTAIGQSALRDNTSGGNNTAVGLAAMLNTETGQQNVGLGTSAMSGNISGSNNVAIGASALGTSTLGAFNVAIGTLALFSATGHSNIAIGEGAGSAITIGGSNILIGNAGLSADANRIRIGTVGSQTSAFIAGINGAAVNPSSAAVIVSPSGQLGTVLSSRRFKEDIRDMGDASARLMRLRPVTFRYRQPLEDGSRPLDFGLIAEEVAEVYPELAVRGLDGQVETVAYHKLPALLLNEVQKQQATIEAQAAAIAALTARLTALETTALQQQR
jgi:hypothetical protein